MRSSSSMRGKEGTTFTKGKIVTSGSSASVRPSIVQRNEGRRSILRSDGRRPSSGAAGPRGRSRAYLSFLEIIHPLVDVVVVLAAIAPADAVDYTRHDVVVVFLRIVEAVEVADRDTDHERESKLEHDRRFRLGPLDMTPCRDRR